MAHRDLKGECLGTHPSCACDQLGIQMLCNHRGAFGGILCGHTCRMDAQAAAMGAPPGSAAPRAGAHVRAANTDSRVASVRKAMKADGAPQPSLPVGGSMKNISIPARLPDPVKCVQSLLTDAQGQGSRSGSVVRLGIGVGVQSYIQHRVYT